MRAFPVCVPQAGKVRLSWSHLTGDKDGGWEVRGPGQPVGQSPEMSPSVLSHLLWEAPGAGDDLG